MWSRLSPFLILGLMAMASPVQACMADNDVDAGAGLSFPSSGSVFQFAHLPAQARGFVRMKLQTAGDRWEIAETGEIGPLAWRAVHGGEGLKLWIWGKAEGQVEIPLRYVSAKGSPRPARIVVKITPPLPPPELPLLTVDSATFTGTIGSHRPFNIRLKIPLAPDHHWEVREAVSSRYNGPGEAEWKPFDVKPLPAESDLFQAITYGEKARIVFIQKSQDGQSLPETVTLILTVMPATAC